MPEEPIDYEEEAEVPLHRDLYPESLIELNKDIISPASEKFWEEINKDLVLSNLRDPEIEAIRGLLIVAGDCRRGGLQGWKDDKGCYHEGAADYAIRDAMIILNSARSRLGFERRMSATQIVQQEKTIERTTKKKKGKWRVF